MAKKPFGPTYGVVKSEMKKVAQELAALMPSQPPVMQERIKAALQNLKAADVVLDCGQSQAPLDPGAPPPDGTATARKGGKRR